MISTVILFYQSYRGNGKSLYIAAYHHDLKGTLRNSFQPLVAVLYIPLTYSINKYLKSQLSHY